MVGAVLGIKWELSFVKIGLNTTVPEKDAIR